MHLMIFDLEQVVLKSASAPGEILLHRCSAVERLCVRVLFSVSPVEGVGLCDGPVQATGCSVTDELEQ